MPATPTTAFFNKPQTIFFNCSMPRSGSTLLQNVLGQNPDFYVTPTSGLMELVYSAQNAFNSTQEFKAALDQKEADRSLAGFVRGGMQGYFSTLTDKPYVVDKCRGWGIYRQMLDKAFAHQAQGVKILCMVRDIRQVIASMEKKFRSNPERQGTEQNHVEMTGTTVFKRTVRWLNGPPTGLSLERLLAVFEQKLQDRTLFIRFEDFTREPAKEMKEIYKFLEVPDFAGHDFDNVEQVTHENDIVHGMFGDHTIRGKIRPIEKDYRDWLNREAIDYIETFAAFYFKQFGYSK